MLVCVPHHAVGSCPFLCDAPELSLPHCSTLRPIPLLSLCHATTPSSLSLSLSFISPHSAGSSATGLWRVRIHVPGAHLGRCTPCGVGKASPFSLSTKHCNWPLVCKDGRVFFGWPLALVSSSRSQWPRPAPLPRRHCLLRSATFCAVSQAGRLKPLVGLMAPRGNQTLTPLRPIHPSLSTPCPVFPAMMENALHSLSHM